MELIGASVVVFLTLCLLKSGTATGADGVAGYETGVKILTPEEVANFVVSKSNRRGDKFRETQFAKDTSSRYLPPDNGGNYGDLIYRYRENGDVLLLREVVVIDELSSTELDIRWYANLKAARRISTVRVLNIGRDRAYCVRIDAAAAETQAIFRVAPYCDPRVMIEIYGF